MKVCFFQAGERRVGRSFQFTRLEEACAGRRLPAVNGSLAGAE